MFEKKFLPHRRHTHLRYIDHSMEAVVVLTTKQTRKINSADEVSCYLIVNHLVHIVANTVSRIIETSFA
jgi:hypothetical protein